MNETRKVFGHAVAEKLQVFFTENGFSVFTRTITKNTIPMVRAVADSIFLSHASLKISNVGDQQLFDLHDGYLKCLHQTQALKNHDDFKILKDQQDLAWRGIMSWIKKQSKAKNSSNSNWLSSSPLDQISGTPDWLTGEDSFDRNPVFGSSERIPKVLDEVCLEISLMLDVVPALWPLDVQKEYNIDLVRFCKRSIDIYYLEVLEHLLKGLIGDIETEVNDRSKLAKAQTENTRLNQYIDELVGLQRTALQQKSAEFAGIILQVLKIATSDVSAAVVRSTFGAKAEQIQTEWLTKAELSPEDQVKWLTTFMFNDPKV